MKGWREKTARGGGNFREEEEEEEEEEEKKTVRALKLVKAEGDEDARRSEEHVGGSI